MSTQVVAAVGAAALACALSACGSEDGASPIKQGDTSEQYGNAPLLEATVEKVHPWDKSAFTQGLETAEDGRLLVGTGLRGESRIYYTDLEGQKGSEQKLSDNFFGEGVAIHGDTVWQLTWQEHTAIKRDARTLEETGRADYETEGWGLCSQQDRLVMSDGSGTLTFRDPETFDKTGSVDVPGTDQLNELECTEDGKVWANVWQTNTILEIDPEDGKVTHVVDTSGLFPAAKRDGADVLNGIAVVPNSTPEDHRFYLTGKLWDEMYEVRFKEPQA
ncbi:glutaminyl-peptide cyclotransferase [Corynebacterium macclintockiae]|uniref:glutaminyl-peptide cyclotransferase n=1 Tax=Corynebacterium macclintockiae TaxID=2913501 RepID=UPI003EBCF198